MLLSELQTAFLLEMAKKYIWWKKPEESILHPRRILAQIMNLGVWDDWCAMSEWFTLKDLADILRSAEAGQFSGRSWHFWANRLLGEIPPMPTRVFQ